MIPSRQAFLDSRRSGLGGSDLGVILGLNPWKTPYQLWQEKTGQAESTHDTLQTRFGTYAEEFVAQEYTRATGRRVQRFHATLTHPTAPVIGHVDRLVIPDGAKRAAHIRDVRTDRLLECKTASAFAVSRGIAWGDPGTDQIPASYLVQIAAYQALTGCQYADLAVIFGNQEFRIYHIQRDLDLEAMLLDEASRWWTNHIVGGCPPDPSTETEARQRWSAHRPGTAIEADDDLVGMVRELATIQATRRDLEHDEQGLRDRIIPRIADAERMTWQGRDLLTYRLNKPSIKTDWKGLAESLMEDYGESEREEFILANTAPVPGARVLRLNTKEISA